MEMEALTHSKVVEVGIIFQLTKTGLLIALT